MSNIQEFRAPSAVVMHGDQTIGTVGCVVRWQDKRYLTTAAHVVPGFSDPLHVLGLGVVEVVRIVWDESTDIALLKPQVAIPDTACLLPDGTRITGMAVTAVADQRVILFRRAAHAATVTHIQQRPTTTTLHPFLCTSIVTQDGDSGALLMDGNLRALGTLVGERNGFDCFMPLASLFPLLNLTLEI